MLTYARIDAIAKRLQGRIAVSENLDIGLLGVTGTTIGTDLVNLIGEGVEDMMKIYLSMVYVMPLLNSHPFLSTIAEKLICAEIYLTCFPTQGESSDNQDSYTSVLRTQALNEFQILFDGLGIFVAGATNSSLQIQNDENKTQQVVKTLFLPGERIKQYIGYDTNEDGIVDTDLFKRNANVEPSFYLSGELEKRIDGSEDIIEGVRVRPKDYISRQNEVVSFW